MRTLLILAFCSLGCSTSQSGAPGDEAGASIPGHVVATGEVLTTVNGQKITQDMIDALIPEEMQKQLKARGQLSGVTEQLVVGELLYQEALKREIHKDAKVQTNIAFKAREILGQNLLEQIVEERITDEVKQKYYDDHKVQFSSTEMDASHILVKEEALINKIKTQLDGGADFATLAGKHSVDPGSAKQGGKLGTFQKGKMVPQFERVAFTTPEGKVSAPVKTQFGWHVILVHKKTTTYKSISEVDEQIKQAAAQEIVKAYFEEIKEGATIVEASTDGTESSSDDLKGAAGKAATSGKPTIRLAPSKGKGKGKKAKGKKAKGKKAKSKKAKSKAKE